MTNTNGVLTCTNMENYEIFCNGGTENQIYWGIQVPRSVKWNFDMAFMVHIIFLSDQSYSVLFAISAY